jgi:two-component system, chemotaxis family, chemotaxis protein CheY
MKKKSPHILIVDDSSVFRKGISFLLRKNSYSTEVAINGFQALEMIENNKYDLIVTDQEMPEMTGLELLLLIRTNFTKEELPVIALTGQQNTDTIKTLIEYGVNGYIVKSNDMNPLLSKINSLLGLT